METESSPQPGEFSNTARSVTTIWLIIHFFLLLVICGSNLTPSALQVRLTSVFRPYTRLLNLDFSNRIGEDVGQLGTPYHLTHSTFSDTDHRVELLPAGAEESSADNWLNLAEGWRGSDRRHRFQRLADCFAHLSDMEDRGAVSILAQSICGSYFKRGTKLAQVRCRSHLGVDRAETARGDAGDPNDENYFQNNYAADVVVVADTISLNRKDAASQVARPGRRTRRSRP